MFHGLLKHIEIINCSIQDIILAFSFLLIFLKHKWFLMPLSVFVLMALQEEQEASLMKIL